MAGLGGQAQQYGQGLQGMGNMYNTGYGAANNIYNQGYAGANSMYGMGMNGIGGIYNTGVDARTNQAQMALAFGAQKASLAQQGGNAAAAGMTNFGGSRGIGNIGSSLGSAVGKYISSAMPIPQGYLSGNSTDPFVNSNADVFNQIASGDNYG
jgi:hypothetical protein